MSPTFYCNTCAQFKLGYVCEACNSTLVNLDREPLKIVITSDSRSSHMCVYRLNDVLKS